MTEQNEAKAALETGEALNRLSGYSRDRQFIWFLTYGQTLLGETVGVPYRRMTARENFRYWLGNRWWRIRAAIADKLDRIAEFVRYGRDDLDECE